MKQTFNFPYFGAGKATYFEWAEVQVIFKKEPTKEQKEQIEKSIPLPIKNFISWEENALSVGSEREVQISIASFYQTKDGKDPKNQKDYEDDGWFFASSSQIDAFNKDIEKWLNKINHFSSILLAFRRSDPGYLQNTVFSDWHKWSIQRFKNILPVFDMVIQDCDYVSIKSYVLRKILYMEREKIDEKYIRYLLYPKKNEIKAFLIYPFKISN